ncbi:Ig-like domain-containing protein [Thalassobaculum sp. OXR-137]|uniref:LysM peptidoglycan-binding domain-containing protein n=1 Tax=Thalassobaculum sp. OXR-137 TaxID=3100173 RepID=UPI002AC89DB1|nr:Ig-like domain-containing protein [Thalassobaculum sp. OXR-137]WPZ33445.1 Ig-like domain-containing protein [Thalassobaculum sp. OXR-137]
MVSKPALVGVMGGVAILAALGLNFWLVPGDEEEPKTTVSAPAGSSTGTQQGGVNVPSTGTANYGSVLPKREPSKKPAASPTDPAKEPPAVMAKRRPSFDIVRVDPDGNTVIAGRAKPNAEVTILDGDREIGKVTSDERGEWVFLPDHQLGPGQFSLTLRQTGESETAESEEAVVLVVPESGKDIAGRPTSEPSQPLAMVMPRDEAKGGATRVLQAPTAGPATADAAPSETKTVTADAQSPASATPAAEIPPAQSAAAPPAETAASQAKPAQSATAENAPVQSVPSATTGSDQPASDAQSAPSSVAVKAFPEPAKAPSSADQPAAADVAQAGDVSVDVIEYDDKGEVVFGGRTEPNADVEVYIDNKPAGNATADAEGRWQLTPKEPVAPGNYNLRVDKVDSGGKVAARVAFPFVRAAPLKGLPNDRLVVIQPGNNLWVIATRVYGEGLRYVQIHDANRDQIQNPDLIYPGQVFGLPTVN